MNRSKEAFVQRWRAKLAAGFLFGITSDAKDGTLARAGRALGIADEVDRLLSEMWEDDQRAQQPATGPAQAKGAK